MCRLLICMCLVAMVGFGFAAEEPGALRKMKPPKGVTLTAEEEKMLEEANRALEAGHKLLLEAHDPAAAVEQLRRALAIANQLKLLKPEQLMTGSLSGRGTPEDKIETEGGMERIIEIAANMAVEAPAEVDNGLHKRKIAKQAGDETRKLAQEQKQLSEQIAQAQAEAQVQQQQQQGGAQKQKSKGVQQNVLIQQSAQGQAQPESQQAQQQQNQQQQNGGGQQKQPDQKNQDQKAAQNQQQTTQQDQNGQQNQNQQNQQGQQTANGEQNQNQQAQQQNAGQAGPDQMARNQEKIAQALHRLATALTPGQGEQENPEEAKASQAFRKAGDEAARTAEMLRNNQLDSAAAASRQVERAIGEALAAAGANAAQRQAEALAALQKQIEGAQNAQQKILGQTQQIQKNADGTAASEELQKDRARALAIEQGKLKPQLDNLQKTLGELGEAQEGNTGRQDAGATSRAREEVNNATNELQKGRAKQALVNAAMRLANGEPASAATAMTQVQAALNAAQRHIEAAANALAGNNAGLQQEYRQVQQAAAALRRLQRDAQANTAGEQTSKGAGEKGNEQNSTQAAEHGKSTGGQDARAPRDKDGVAMSATWGGMLNRSAQQVNSDLQKLAPALANVNPEAAKEIGALASKGTAFERDREGSLAQVASLLKEVEKIELALAKKVAGEEERKALNNYRKDDIPLPYRKAVAAFYEELSKDSK